MQVQGDELELSAKQVAAIKQYLELENLGVSAQDEFVSMHVTGDAFNKEAEFWYPATKPDDFYVLKCKLYIEFVDHCSVTFKREQRLDSPTEVTPKSLEVIENREYVT